MLNFDAIEYSDVWPSQLPRTVTRDKRKRKLGNCGRQTTQILCRTKSKLRVKAELDLRGSSRKARRDSGQKDSVFDKLQEQRQDDDSALLRLGYRPSGNKQLQQGMRVSQVILSK